MQFRVLLLMKNEENQEGKGGKLKEEKIGFNDFHV
jgi:hypothetical protein